MRQILMLGLLTMGWSLAACGPAPDDTATRPKPQTGREETQGIRNTEAIGYSGDAIANKVDGALNAGDAQKAKTDEALQNAE